MKSNEKVEDYSDGKLLKLCSLYGRRSLKWRYKFIGLLPEVYRRKLYEKKGFSSIFEFAAKLAGVSEAQVRRVLNLDERCEKEGLVQMRALLVNGEVSVNKLARVLPIATPENEGELLAKTTVLPNRAVETLVHDFNHENGFDKPKDEAKSVHVHMLNLSPETLQKLLKLQQQGHNLDQLIGEFLDQREQKIEEEKRAIVKEQEQQEYEHEWVKDWREVNRLLYGDLVAREPDVIKKPSRYISKRIRNVLYQEFGTKCAIPYCSNPSEQIHHTDRFSLSKTHNPYFLAPLCRGHHVRAHAVDQKVQQKRTEACRNYE